LADSAQDRVRVKRISSQGGKRKPSLLHDIGRTLHDQTPFLVFGPLALCQATPLCATQLCGPLGLARPSGSKNRGATGRRRRTNRRPSFQKPFSLGAFHVESNFSMACCFETACLAGGFRTDERKCSKNFRDLVFQIIDPLTPRQAKHFEQCKLWVPKGIE